MPATTDVRPFLAKNAVLKDPSPPMPGRYCFQQDLWIVNSFDGDLPLVSGDQAALATETKVGGEHSDKLFDPVIAAATQTAVTPEAPDRNRDVTMVGMATVTETGGEQLDAPARDFWLQFATVTRVLGEATDSR